MVCVLQLRTKQLGALQLRVVEACALELGAVQVQPTRLHV
jgi:hypothetical protein